MPILQDIEFDTSKVDDIIRGEPEWAPNTREIVSGVYIYIYLYIYLLCVILHSNGLMRMLNHHVLERDW